MSKQTNVNRRWQEIGQGFLVWIFAVVLTVGMTFILSFNISSLSNASVTVGQPAPDDILAPRSITYISEVETAAARERARTNVPEQYTPFNLSIGREQLDKARAIFAFIETVRADTQASVATRVAYLQAIEDINVEGQVAGDLLSLQTVDYETAKDAILTVIAELMRQEIRSEQLSAVRRTARQASPLLTPTQESVFSSLAHQFIVETVFPDEEQTIQAREEAATQIEPVEREIFRNQRVVRAGDIVTELDIEELTQLGLLQPRPGWRDVGSLFMASLLGVVVITLYWQQFHHKSYANARYMAALAGLILLFTLIGKLLVSAPGFLPYIFPVAALSMLLAVMFDIRLSMIVTIVLAAIVGFIAQNSLELGIYTAAGGLLAILTLHDAQRVNAFFRAGVVAAVGHMAVILAFRLPQNVDVLELLQLLLYGLGNGVFSAALTLIGFFVLGSLFGVTTTLQLQDLSRLDHPLLQELLRRAPGTYHHSIMVANLAEQAAERVRANATLVRVGAFYHDIGKMNRPPFFTENQEGVNPHDTLDPYTSARIIISHVSDGLELASRYRLPDRIKDCIAEHHGTSVVKGFYMKACEQDGEEEVDIAEFTYPGPRPRSRETGIVMMADTIEATSSALRPSTEKAIEKLVNSIIDGAVTTGQLDDSGLTLGDIQLIRTSIIETLKGRFHVRIKYPGNEQMMAEEEDAEAAGGPAPETVAGEAADEEGETDDGHDGEAAPVAAEDEQETDADEVSTQSPETAVLHPPSSSVNAQQQPQPVPDSMPSQDAPK